MLKKYKPLRSKINQQQVRFLAHLNLKIKVQKLQLPQLLEAEDYLGLQKWTLSLHKHLGFLVMIKSKELPCYQEDFSGLKINKLNLKKPLYLLVFFQAILLFLITKLLKIKTKPKQRKSKSHPN